MSVAGLLAHIILVAAVPPPVVNSPDGGLQCSLGVKFAGTGAAPALSTNTINVICGSQSAQATVAGNKSWSTTLTVPEDGSYSASVTETEAATVGGGTGTSQPTVVDFRVETVAPPLTMSEPASPGQNYVTDSVLASGTSVAGARVNLSLLGDGGEIVDSASVPVPDGGAWTALLTAPGDGVFTLVTSTDSDDVCALEGDPNDMAIVVDTQPARILSPDAGSTLNRADVTLFGSGVANTQVRVTLDGAPADAPVAADGGWSLAVQLVDGTNSVTAQSEDHTGALGAADMASYDVFLTRITTPTQGSQTLEQVQIDGAAEPNTTVTLSATNDGGVIGNPAGVLADGGWSSSLTLPPGQHTLTAVDVDANQNVGSSASVTFTVEEPATTSSTSTSSATSSSASGTSSSASTTSTVSSSGSSGHASSTSATSSSGGHASSSSGTSATSNSSSGASASSGASSGSTSSTSTAATSTSSSGASASTSAASAASASTSSSGSAASSSSSSTASGSGGSGSASGSATAGNSTSGSASAGSTGSDTPLSLYRGCGCQSGDAGLGAWALGAIALLARRRRPAR